LRKAFILGWILFILELGIAFVVEYDIGGRERRFLCFGKGSFILVRKILGRAARKMTRGTEWPGSLPLSHPFLIYYPFSDFNGF